MSTYTCVELIYINKTQWIWAEVCVWGRVCWKERETQRERKRVERKRHRYKSGEGQEMGRAYCVRVTLGQIKEV